MMNAQLREAMRLWLRLEEARNTIAESRFSIYLQADAVDAVTLQVVDLQAKIMHVIRFGELPELPKLGSL